MSWVYQPPPRFHPMAIPPYDELLVTASKLRLDQLEQYQELNKQLRSYMFIPELLEQLRYQSVLGATRSVERYVTRLELNNGADVDPEPFFTFRDVLQEARSLIQSGEAGPEWLVFGADTMELYCLNYEDERNDPSSRRLNKRAWKLLLKAQPALAPLDYYIRNPDSVRASSQALFTNRVYVRNISHDIIQYENTFGEETFV